MSPVYPSGASGFTLSFYEVRIAQSLGFYVVFCRSLLCCLYFDLRYLHTFLTLSFSYHTLQGDNSLKSIEGFDHMMFVCRFQASRWSKPQREKL